MASSHKGTHRPATSLVLSCGSCLPGMLAFAWGRSNAVSMALRCTTVHLGRIALFLGDKHSGAQGRSSCKCLSELAECPHDALQQSRDHPISNYSGTVPRVCVERVPLAMHLAIITVKSDSLIAQSSPLSLAANSAPSPCNLRSIRKRVLLQGCQAGLPFTERYHRGASRPLPAPPVLSCRCDGTLTGYCGVRCVGGRMR